jgi:thiol-disulfide isomerase/thioredoxin
MVMLRSRESAGFRLSGLALFSAVLIGAACPAAAPDGGKPSPEGAAAPAVAGEDPAVGLVRRLYEDGSWTSRLSSFYVRSETVDEKAPGGGAAAPGAEVAKGSARKSISEFGFDRDRLRSEWRSEGSTSMTLWDGKEGIQYYRTKDHESYELCRDTGYWGWHDLWGYHQWADIGGYSFWWHPRDARAYLAANTLLPEDFAYAGREVFAGAECHAVESRGGFMKLLIGATDGRLRGIVHYVPGGGVDYVRVVRAIGKGKVKAAADWGPWLATLDPAERRRAEKKYFDVVARKYHEYAFDDYRQVGPGRWVPWKVTMSVYDVNGGRSSPPKETSTTTILEVKADEPVRDNFFRFEMKDGVQVSDYRFDLPEEDPISYAYKAGRTEAEFRALHEAARKDLEKRRKAYAGLTAGVASRLGRKPPELPQGSWLNSKPLAWKDLTGKVVVLEFWAHDCGPCRGDFEVFGKDFKAFADAGVTIIGVHTATKSPEDVEKVIEALKPSIPICIDAPGPEGKAFGAMTAWFGIDGTGQKRYPYLGGHGVIRIPYAVVVGKSGRVAAHGYLWEMLVRARELAAAPGGREEPAPADDEKTAGDGPTPAPQPPAAEAGANRSKR